ncbi:N-terminal phage integrase SAM-like domain-containing protein [Amycolatopsis sp. NPDC098790]|uniref:N-terminal phage integrase SAM-like domain-containing protein n=1 Tax=Amycolatopsis sp. NPDC098790 TaxID=3363939 RepID=UPI0038156272
MLRWFRPLDLDPRTIESYRSRLRCHILPKFGHMPLGAITAPDVTEWIRELERGGVGHVDGELAAEPAVDAADRCRR